MVKPLAVYRFNDVVKLELPSFQEIMNSNNTINTNSSISSNNTNKEKKASPSNLNNLNYLNSEFKNKTSENNSGKHIHDFYRFLNTTQMSLSKKEFVFEDGAIERLGELHLQLLGVGFHYSEKGANFSNIIDMTLLDFFVKLSCLVCASWGRHEVSVFDVECAFVDLFEFFNMQLDFIKNKIRGTLDYGEGWQGAMHKDQECLEWLFNEGAISFDESNISIDNFIIQIGMLKGIKYDSARRHYYRFKKNNWICRKQVKQYGSKVWLAFTPQYVGAKLKVAQGDQGRKGEHSYRIIISDILAKKHNLRDIPPLPPFTPLDVEEEIISPETIYQPCHKCGALRFQLS